MSEPESRNALLLISYRRYLQDRNTVQFVSVVKNRYSPGTLERLARASRPDLRRAATFALGFVGDFSVNHTVGRALRDEDPVVRRLAVNACRFVWNRPGSQQQRERLGEIIRLNAVGEHHYAAEQAMELLDDVPWIAEAWYQLGAACFQLSHFDRATTNCHQALELNPYHYVAATAMGEAYLRLDEPASALEAFRRALRLNPALHTLRDRVEQLSQQFDGE
jgi:tetratricopeptide (TPR) repeat protein